MKERTLHIVLVEPEIPPNTGNVARLCAAIGAQLHLIKPLGFSIDDKSLKRAGLDYWSEVQVTVHENFKEFEEGHQTASVYLTTTQGNHCYTGINYDEEVAVLFGAETRGLSPEILAKYPDRWIRLPMREKCRSLNLSKAVAVMAYEVLRQWDYPQLV